MEKRQIGLKLAMDGVGLPVNVEGFDDRLILQKAIYLAQAAGVNFGYHYRWYLRGPYCPAVADDGFAVSREIKSGYDDSQRWKLDEISSGKLEGIRKLIGTRVATQELAKKLELLASVHFLVDKKQVSRPDSELITKKLKCFNKQFRKSKVEKSLELLRNHELLS